MIITEILQSYLKHHVVCIIHDMYIYVFLLFYFYGSPPVWAYHMTLHEIMRCACVECVCVCVECVYVLCVHVCVCVWYVYRSV